MLGGSRVLPTEEIFAAALRVQDSLPTSQTSQPVKTSALIASSGAPRASGKSTSSGKTRTSYPPCKYCGKPTHPSDKCWKEFGKPAWALAASGGRASSTTSPPEGSSSTTTPSAAGTVSLALSPSELAYIQASRASSLCPTAAPSASLAALTSSLVSYAGGRGSSPGTPSISTPHMTSWVIDSGASSHMTGFPSVLTSYRPETSIPDVRIADGRSCPVLGSGQSRATSSLPLQHVLYILGFPSNLLSISAITKALHCGVFFFPHHCVFQDLDTSQRIGLGRENGRGIYELVANSPSTGLQALFALSASSSSLHDSLLWHCRLGHPSFVKLKETLPWLHLSEFHCESCELGKHHRSSYPSRTGPPTHRPFDLVHCDVWGPTPHTSPTGGKYYMVFVDDYTRASWTYILKSRKEVFSRVQHFLLEIITQYETMVKILRTDNALEFTQKAIEELYLAHGIVHQTTCPYTSQQNGVAERKHRHLLDIIRTLLLAMRVPQYLWCEAVLTATYLVNRLPSAALRGAIPLQRLTPAADLFSLPPRVFACTAFVQDHTPGLSKLAPRAQKGVFVGYSRTQKGYRVYFPDRRQYITSADVTFHEDVPYFTSTLSGEDLSSPSLLPSVSTTIVTNLPMTVPIPLPEVSPPSASLPSDPSFEPESPSSPLSTVPAPLSPPPSPPPPVSDLDLPIALRKGTRQCTQYHIAHHVSPARLSPSYQSIALAVLTESIPKSYIEALQVPAWKAAMDVEYVAFIQRETWTLVPRLIDANVVSCKWVYSLKYNLDGSIARYKARLVARGFSQAYGLDYHETFSPVARLSSIRVLFSIALDQSWPLHQLDVSNAFLYGDLDEQVFMEQPPGYVAQGESSEVCLLKKAIYGLKQSPRAWFHKFLQLLFSYGFVSTVSNPTVMRKRTPHGCVILSVYVDDIIITSSDDAEVAATKAFLAQHFVTRDLSPPRYFLGLEIAYRQGQMSICQQKYVLDLLEETGTLGCKPASSPMEQNVDWWDNATTLLEDAGIYRQLVGKLIFLTVTRPDISYAVSILSQFMQAPRTIHMEGVYRLLAYLKRAPGKGLLYRRQGHLHIEAYSDSGFASDKEDRKSHCGYATYVGGNLVTWRSQKQSIVSRSSAEAEYRAMADTTTEMLWLRSLLIELGFPPEGPMQMYCDNMAATFIASNATFHMRTKHIEIDCHFIQQYVDNGTICTPHVASAHQLADIFTKALPGPAYETIGSKLGMFDLHAPA